MTIRNDNRFPVRVATVRPGAAGVSADVAHRNAGCIQTGVVLVGSPFSVAWPVPARSSAKFRLPISIKMTNASHSACQGAIFSVPLTLTGQSNAS
ncbi:hypothetical protein ACQP2E_34855 [Actinoplanes sp. CA-015351]|uniref:hypothetical protein n=1 Tax=Actinoplanes sp. CA-015351 TaxID=3239897 RepID=UPI003D98B2C5